MHEQYSPVFCSANTFLETFKFLYDFFWWPLSRVGVLKMRLSETWSKVSSSLVTSRQDVNQIFKF